MTADCTNRLKLLPPIVLFLSCVDLYSAELKTIEVERDDNYYHLESTTSFDAAAEDLYRVLTDYDQFKRFTSAIVESENVEPDEKGRPQFYTRMEGCVLLFCKSFVRHGYLELEPNVEIVAIADPEKSDFKRVRESWKFVREEEGTTLIYEFEMVPDFWVPPVIGPYYIQRALKSGGKDAVNRIEALALGKEPQK